MVMFSVEPVTVLSTQFSAPATAGGQVALGEKVGPGMLPLNEIVPVPVASTVPARGGETGEDVSQLRPLGGSSVTLTLMSGVRARLVPSKVPEPELDESVTTNPVSSCEAAKVQLVMVMLPPASMVPEQPAGSATL